MGNCGEKNFLRNEGDGKGPEGTGTWASREGSGERSPAANRRLNTLKGPWIAADATAARCATPRPPLLHGRHQATFVPFRECPWTNSASNALRGEGRVREGPRSERAVSERGSSPSAGLVRPQWTHIALHTALGRWGKGQKQRSTAAFERYQFGQIARCGLGMKNMSTAERRKNTHCPRGEERLGASEKSGTRCKIRKATE